MRTAGTRRLRSVRGGRLAAILVVPLLVAGCASPVPSGVATAMATPRTTTSEDAATPASGVAASSPEGSPPPRGGTLRVVMAPGDAALRDPSPDVLDPQVDGSLWLSTELWRCCLVRTLLSHNGRSAGDGGARLHPDLAEALPEVSADGLTWTFHLKPGLRYGPPLESVEITAGDFVRGFHRLLSSSIAPWSAWQLLIIDGAAEYSDGTASSIAGIEAPDDHTVVFHLTEPAGDFGARLALAATGPLPPDPLHPDATTGVAAGSDTGYGRFLVSSGPYMLEGSEALDFSVPAAERAPVAGFAPGRITLVRNPSWDPASDDLRPAYADRIEITVADSVDAAVAALDAGSVDLVVPSGGTPADAEAAVAAFGADPARGRVHADPTVLVRNAYMNIAVPPFDDVHVRKALTWVLDRKRLADLEGGSVGRGIFGHVLADIYEDDLLGDYDPYATPGGHGDLEKARAEMRLSRYDADGDGRCDAPACAHVRAITRELIAPVAREMAHEASALGIGLDVDVLDDTTFWDVNAHPADKVPIIVSMAFGNSYISASWFATWLDGRLSVDVPPDTYNYTMLGATPEQLERWGYAVTDVPSVDGRVEACLPLVGAAQFRCWASLDQYLMESVVPLLPYAVVRNVSFSSPRVVTYDFSTFTTSPAFDRLAVRP